MVRLHIFPIFSFLAKLLSFLLRDDNIFGWMGLQGIAKHSKELHLNSKYIESGSCIESLSGQHLDFRTKFETTKHSAQCSDYYMWRHISAPPRNLASFRWSPSIENMYVLCSILIVHTSRCYLVLQGNMNWDAIYVHMYSVHTLSVRGLCSVKKTGARKFYNALITIFPQ